MSYLEICNLTFSYAHDVSPVIDNFSLTLDRGEIVGILGPSGSGKSTLLRLIAGLEVPTRGSISIDGRVMVDGRVFVAPEKRGVGMIFQDYGLFPHLTVAKNIAFGLHRLLKTEKRLRVHEMLELVRLTGFEQRYPHELSGGQQQRVALARALAPGPSVLLLDEPFSSIDVELKEAIRSELKEILNKAQMTCLFVSHDPQDIKAVCHRWVMLDQETKVR